MTAQTSIYIHVPFCVHRCAYCDFNTYAGKEVYQDAYVDALIQEARQVGASAGERIPVHTVFFGGGTPSLLTLPQMERIMQTLEKTFELAPEAEISLEANPGTIDAQKLAGLRSMGFNRISLGMQSANPEELRFLERIHDPVDVITAVKDARRAGFNNLNLDLIFGLPGQSLESWQRSLEFALRLRPEHLSLYALSIEQGTPLRKWLERGLIQDTDPDLAADMYEWAEQRLETEGFIHYEISNWGRKDHDGGYLACRHNLTYWRNQPYLGFGAGAHGYAAGVRTANVLAIPVYIRRVQAGKAADRFPAGPASVNLERIDRWTEMQETLMVGLRLTDEGVSAQSFALRFGEPLQQVFGVQIEQLRAEGLLEWSGENQDRLRLTQRGRLLGNQVFMEFVGD
jgi:oxygen-independent coproporphyrinogen III oxidase